MDTEQWRAVLLDLTTALKNSSAEVARLRALLDYGTDTDAYRRLRAQNDSLRAELAASKKCSVCGGPTDREASASVVRRLRAELDEVKAEGRQEIANVASNYRAAARHDAEEIARLRSNLGHLVTLIDRGVAFSAQTMSEVRAALACRPQGERSET